MNRRLSNLVVGFLAALVLATIALHRRGSPVEPFFSKLDRTALAGPAEGIAGPYDPQPDHIWNRVHRQFFVRLTSEGKQFGNDELDPLLWFETKYLVSGPSHKEALNLLDEFLAKRAENLITDPLKRAMLQRDLWAIFDWLSLKEDHRLEREALQTKLARVIQRLALTADQIKLLPDNYAAAARTGSFPKQYQPEKHEAVFLPPELLQEQGPWILIGDMRGRLPAPVHTASSPFNGRSTFLILMRLPAGREATIAYLQRLREFPKPWISNPDRSRESEPLVPNPDLPQFPEGTQTALVRRMMLIDRNGNLVPTNLTESVQIRVYRSIPAGTAIRPPEALRTQDVFQFTLSRRKLFDGAAGSLREVLRDEKEFMLFRSHGIDWFEKEGDPESDRFSVLNQCANCHSSPGIHSVLSYSERRFQPSIFPPALSETRIADQEQMALGWKRRQYESGLLRGFWQTTSR